MTRIELTECFRAAAADAKAADPGHENDGGTCNFDWPTFRLPRLHKKFVQGCAHEAGVSVDTHWDGAGRRWFTLCLALYGQAHRRTVMAEAAVKRLKLCGLEARMMYHTD